MVVFVWWCGGVFLVFLWCGGGGGGGGGVFLVFLWWGGGVFVVVFLWWCFCGGVLWLCFCAGVFVVVFLWCFCGGVIVHATLVYKNIWCKSSPYTAHIHNHIKHVLYATVFNAFGISGV